MGKKKKNSKKQERARLEELQRRMLEDARRQREADMERVRQEREKRDREFEEAERELEEKMRIEKEKREARERLMQESLGEKLYERWKDDRGSSWGKTVAKIPFGQYISPNRTLNEAKRLFDSTIVGREREKEEMLRKFATFMVTGKMRRPILLAGEPGCGKSHFAQSLADALGYPVKYINVPALNSPIALVGTERHYSNSRMGDLMQTLIDNETLSAVFVFDEIDKASSEHGEDGSIEAVLLALFDPLWNGKFTDRSLEVPVDMSRCIFICTANEVSSISAPLIDRMDVIRFDSYTEEQALNIINKMSIPGIIAACKMSGKIRFEPNVGKGIVSIVENGSMRDYEKLVEKLVDNAIYKMLKTGRKRYTVTVADIDEIMPSEKRKPVGFCS